MSEIRRHFGRGLDAVKTAQAIGLIPDDWQKKILQSPHKRDLLVVHRQGGKSATAAVAAVDVAMYEKDSLVLVVSPSQRQSQELFKTILTLYRALGRPVPAETENQLSITLENGSRIVALPADATTIRGYSAVKLLIIDEAAFVSDDTMAAVRPMLAVSNGRMLAMSTPFGRRGWFYEASKSREWRVTTVTAEKCPRITREFLEDERNALGGWRYKQEYECQFVDIAGMMFSTDDIDAIGEWARLGLVPSDDHFAGGRHPVTVGVDIGQAVDPTAIVVLNSYMPEPTHIDDKPKQHHLIRSIEKVPLNMTYERIVDRIATVAEYAGEWGHPTIVVDGTGVGRPVVDMLRRRTRLPLRAVTFTGAARESQPDAYSHGVPKRDLVSSLEVALQGRRLHATATDMVYGQDLRAELQSFEVNVNAVGHDTYAAASGKHDDLVMALCLATWWSERGNEGQAFTTAWRRMTEKAKDASYRPAPARSIDAPLVRRFT